MAILIKINSLFSTKRKVILFSLLILLPLVIIEVWSVNRLSTFGEQIVQFEKIKSSLKLENQLLENEISKKSALSNIEREAKAYGFEKITKVEYLTNQKVVLTFK